MYICDQSSEKLALLFLNFQRALFFLAGTLEPSLLLIANVDTVYISVLGLFEPYNMYQGLFSRYTYILKVCRTLRNIYLYFFHLSFSSVSLSGIYQRMRY